MAWLFGEYKHNLDQKNRLAIPAKLREELGESFVITLPNNEDGDRCIYAYSVEDWIEREKILNSGQQPSPELTRRQRFMYDNTDRVDVDKQGRITIPAKFIGHANLEDEVLLKGVGRRMEMWNPNEREEMVKTAEEKNAIPTFEAPF
ncbi:MAG: division/cell wall cluster transcriptional repressor MraZ [Oscillospiraceae bacterium]|nr:division/cell wall cluster transcriptional repressor MraZ [Oscillospiraceae bacterium]